MDLGPAELGPTERHQLHELLPDWLLALRDRIQLDEDGVQRLLDALNAERERLHMDRVEVAKAAAKEAQRLVASSAFPNLSREAVGVLEIITDLVYEEILTPYEMLIQEQLVHYNRSHILPPGFV